MLFSEIRFNYSAKLVRVLLASFLLLFISCSSENEATSISVATGGAVELEEKGLSVVTDLEWPLHNFDLYGSRFVPTDQITPDNVATLTPRWLFQHGVIDGVSNQTTPVIVDEVMYLTDSRGI